MTPATPPPPRPSGPDAPDGPDDERVTQAVERFIALLDDDTSATPPDPLTFAEQYPAELHAEIVAGCRSLLALRPVLARNASTDDDQPRQVAHYTLLELLGKGSMARVFRARDARDGRHVALKLLHDHLESSPVLLERFHREAQVIRSVTSDRVVSIFDVGEDDGHHYIAMELVEGGTLGEALASDDAGDALPWDPARVTAVARDVCAALVAVHAHGIVHRDVKPQNILLDRDGRAKLADFGLAQLVDRRRLTLTGQLQGTPYYMSPEQALARRVPVDHRTDIYSLGVVLYELLTRRRPSEGETSHQVLYAISFQRPRSLRSINPRVSADLETICLKALEKSPDDRFADALEMAGDLERHRLDQPILGRLPTPALRAWRFARRQRARLAAGATLLLLLVVASWLYVQREAERAGWPTLNVRSSSAESGQLLHARRIDPLTTLLGAPLELGAPPLEGLRLEPAAYRLQLSAPSGALAETTVWLDYGEAPTALQLTPRRPTEVDPGMLRVEGARVTLIHSSEVLSDGSTRLIPLVDDAEVAPFLIDATTVTNGAYLAFLATHPEAPRPPFWPDEDSAEWAARSERFDELPLIGLSARAAAAYASSRGARLASLAEWQLAAQGSPPRTFPWGDEPGELLARTRFVEDPPRDMTTRYWEHYNEYVAPAAEAHADNVSPSGLVQPFGNVWELTESPVSSLVDGRFTSFPGAVFTKGADWTALGPLDVQRRGLYSARLSAFRAFDERTGFRCVRPLIPWSTEP